jgi:hypothetical protein
MALIGTSYSAPVAASTSTPFAIRATSTGMSAPIAVTSANTASAVVVD